jgi:hypothetical protein
MRIPRALMIMRLSFLLLALTAAASAAQGGGQPMRPLFGGRDERPPELRAKEIMRLSPARVALERARDISLTPDQFRRLDSLERGYEVRARDFGRALDTLDGVIDGSRRDLARDRLNAAGKRSRNRPENARDSIKQARADSIDQHKMDEHFARGTAGQNGREQVLLSTQQTFDASLAAVNAILTEDQRTKISTILNGLSAEFVQRLHWQNIR